MAGHVCFIVPPYLLSDIAEGQDPEASRLATETLASIEHIHHTRKGFFEAKLAHAHHGGLRTQDIVPDYVLEDIAGAEGVDEATQQNALDTLAANRHFREQRTAGVKDAAAAVTPSAPAAGFARSVYDMETREKKDKGADITYTLLPGKLARSEGQAVASDKAVNEVYDNCLKVLQFFQKIFNYNSLNGQNMPVVSSVHYKKDYQNASWIGVDTGVNPNVTYNQMVYGDGGGDLVNFTNCIDVMGHEMTHAITQFNSGLLYENESGALNEHISDVFGVMVKQWVENKMAKDSDWLIGEGCFMPERKGTALRNMKNPGTAYDKLESLGGKDPQPADYKGIAAFKAASLRNALRVKSDRGGVHLFSGVPNRAFVLCALAFGGYSWEKAGKIWWTTATTHRIAPNCTFLQFADVTVAVAEEQFGVEAAKTVRAAWNEVGVTRTI